MIICTFLTLRGNIKRQSEVYSKIQNQNMGKPIKIFEQWKDEATSLRIVPWNMTLAGEMKGRGGGGTVAQNDPNMVIRDQQKYSQ